MEYLFGRFSLVTYTVTGSIAFAALGLVDVMFFVPAVVLGALGLLGISGLHAEKTSLYSEITPYLVGLGLFLSQFVQNYANIFGSLILTNFPILGINAQWFTSERKVFWLLDLLAPIKICTPRILTG